MRPSGLGVLFFNVNIYNYGSVFDPKIVLKTKNTPQLKSNHGPEVINANVPMQV